MSTLGRILKLSRVDQDEEALERLRRTLRQDPRSVQFVPLAEHCRRRGLFEEGLAACLQGVQHHPAYVSGFVTLARCYQDLGDLDHAVQAFHRVVDLAPQSLTGHQALGELYEQIGDFPRALEHLQLAQALGAIGPEVPERIERIHRHLNSVALQAEDGRQAGQERLESLLQAKLAALHAYRSRFFPEGG